MSTLFLEGAVQQRPPERIAYTVDTSAYGGSPTSPSVALYDVTSSVDATGTDVSGDKLDGAASVAGDVITTPHVEALEGGKRYRLSITFVCGGQTYSPHVFIHGVY